MTSVVPPEPLVVGVKVGSPVGTVPVPDVPVAGLPEGPASAEVDMIRV